jgi:predicted phage baseplate assembly protein
MAATAALATNPGSAVPAITLIGAQAEGPFDWYPLRDLLGSRQGDRAFVVECEHDGTSLLRFGDGAHGMRPVEGTGFTASFRVGNGVAGNIGHDSLTHVVSTLDDVLGVTNPLPAAGGVEPESGEHIRRGAPATLAVQERAVTPADYEAKAQLSRTVARAAATFRWTGSWHTVFVTADRVGGAPVDRPFETALRADLERYRMAGYDLEVDGPRLVPITIGLHICVAPGHHRADVSRAVRVVLSNRMLPDGRLGMFHPDRFTFGQPVYLSAVLAAVHSVPGVQSVDPVSFERQRLSQTSGLEDGVLPMGRLEVARLDQDPNFPERGVLELTFGGGS